VKTRIVILSYVNCLNTKKIREVSIMRKKGMKSFLAGVLVVLLLVTFGAIISPAEGKEFSMTLKFAEPVPPNSFQGRMHQWWAQEVEKRTNGRIKIQFFWMESLVKWKDMLHGVNSGIADLGVIACAYHPSDFPVFMVVDMPYNINDYWTGMRAAIDTARNDPNLEKEFGKAGIKHLAPYCSGYLQFHLRKPIKDLSDLKNKTIRCFGGARVKYHQGLGFNPVFLSYPEIYEAMDRGTIFGYDMVMMLSDAYKLYEVGTYVIEVNSGANVGSGLIGMNLKIWNKLPKDIQKIILDLGLDFSAYYSREQMAYEDSAKAKWQKFGVTFMKLSPEDEKLAREAGRLAREDFMNKQEANGHPARSTWEFFLKQREKYDTELKEKGYPWER